MTRTVEVPAEIVRCHACGRVLFEATRCWYLVRCKGCRMWNTPSTVSVTKPVDKPLEIGQNSNVE